MQRPIAPQRHRERKDLGVLLRLCGSTSSAERWVSQFPVTDPRGHRTTYDYDALGRRIQETLSDPDGAGPLLSPMTRYVYDLAGNLDQVIRVLDPKRTDMHLSFGPRQLPRLSSLSNFPKVGLQTRLSGLHISRRPTGPSPTNTMRKATVPGRRRSPRTAMGRPTRGHSSSTTASGRRVARPATTWCSSLICRAS